MHVRFGPCKINLLVNKILDKRVTVVLKKMSKWFTEIISNGIHIIIKIYCCKLFLRKFSRASSLTI